MAHQIVYQPDSTKTDTYSVYVDDDAEYKKWLDGDTTIALSSFVGRFDVFHSQTGAQGQWDTASKAQIENDLGTKNKDEAIQTVLKKGEDRSAKTISGTKVYSSKNQSMDSGNSVSKGSHASGGFGGR